ncbi:hypothetical protein GGR56DRAFT_629664 [Xylariaceae sp. FL0804]|nr:hypothetical protein GGR56DRAFT_629664 [Xylariaceae sp. FL0804]
MSLAALWTQFFPPRNGAPLTEASLPRQHGKVFIVTGGSSGLGFELSRILYGAGGAVYMLTRSEERAEAAIGRIRAHYAGVEERSAAGVAAAAADAENSRCSETTGRGRLEFIHMDLLDFTSVTSAARQFLAREGARPDGGRLDVLFNNAGTGARRDAPPSAQGHEYHFCINSLGPYLLTRLLEPMLARTAARNATTAPHEEAGSVRVVWPASIMVEMNSPRGGIRREFLRDQSVVGDPTELYVTSKTANWFLASEFARRQGQGPGQKQKQKGVGVVHIAGNPGQLNSNIWRHTPTLLYLALWPILRDPVHGAETCLWMAFSPSVTLDAAVAGRYAICDGRWHPGQREDLVLALRPSSEGGSGLASEYYAWCQGKVDEFLQ